MTTKNDCYAIMDKKPKSKGKGKGKRTLPPFLFLFFLFVSFIIPVSAFRVIDYDSFEYANKTGNDLIPYGWQSMINGNPVNLSNVAITADKEVVICVDSAKSFNRVNNSYHPTINGSAFGIPLNMTYRYRIRSALSGTPFGSTHYGQAIPYNHQSTGSSISVVPTIRLYNNVTGVTRLTAWQNTSKSPIFNIAYPINYSYYNIQADYVFIEYPSSGYKQVSNVTYYINGVLANSSSVDLLSSGVIAQRINATLFDIVNIAKCYVFDDLYVIAYESGEAFISPTYTIPEYLVATDNRMPLFTTKKTDKSGYETNTIALSTATCNPYELVLTNGSVLSSGCNPLYITFPVLWDYENDSIRYAIDCDYSELYKYATDNFDNPAEEINLLYNSYCDWNPIAYTRTDGLTTTTGLRFNPALNCSEAFLQSPFSNDRSAPHYLYPNAPLLLSWDFTFTTDIWYIFQFIDYNYDTPLWVSVKYESATQNTYLSVNGVIRKYFTSFNNVSVTNMRLYIDDSDNSVSVRLQQGNMISYSDRIPFTWSYPFIYLTIGAKSTDTSSMTGYLKQGQLFGNYSVYESKDQEFKQFTSSSSLNCSSLDYDKFLGFIFISDSVHGDNYLNYESFTWQTDSNLNNVLQNSTNPAVVTDTFNQLFMDSPFLKYLFSLILFLGITFGSFATSAYLGNAMAGGIVAVFAGSATIFFLVLFTILPVWFGIVIFLIMSLIFAFMMKSVFMPSSEG